MVKNNYEQSDVPLGDLAGYEAEALLGRSVILTANSAVTCQIIAVVVKTTGRTYLVSWFNTDEGVFCEAELYEFQLELTE